MNTGPSIPTSALNVGLTDPLCIPRVTDECLAGMIQSPTRYAAWVLRAALVELRDQRETRARLVQVGFDHPTPGGRRQMHESDDGRLCPYKSDRRTLYAIEATP